jgi:hypothetical protein
MKKFLSIPEKFKGVSEVAVENSIFVPMTERNAHRFQSLYERAEGLFTKLAQVERDFEVGSGISPSATANSFSRGFSLDKWTWKS